LSFLLDTHVFLWFETRSTRLSDEAAAVIRRTDVAVYISAASFWKIAIKRRLGKLACDGSARAAAADAGFEELAMDAADAETAGALTSGLRPHARRPLPQSRADAHHGRPRVARAQGHRGRLGGVAESRKLDDGDD
jgi:PIN domain nuclease of toxin-antitoxin system